MKSHIISGIFMLCFFLCQKAKAQEQGVASYYADSFNGQMMANGAVYDPDELTCAHPTAPLGSIMKIARKDNPDQSVIVRVVDRGPYVKGRIVDLSKRAAKELGILHMGIADVVVGLIKSPGVIICP
ncbi:MAG: septal ring lytic transglycosylase RlpA family protein [Saprospiraceae bacterium]|uniref:Probable endolytic peptidoglycan transglycosylase RlpA n=1 Tax=Candidatus Opimibacter skivensis TaxID=2982028 RepID=A0A9D7STF5_9BACT|nr:septal ring lytic transglycosylase RlpA family protein [Candidatus Opimibacter skivensis]